jgi:hypothetical protein
MARVVAAKKKVTPERVAAACRRLGPHVSLRAVQKAIGGSLRDIGPLLRQWREQNPSAPVDLSAPTGPDAMSALLMARLEAQTETLVDAQEDAFRRMQSRLSNQIKDKLKEIAADGVPSRHPAAGVATHTLGDVMRALNALSVELKAGMGSKQTAAPAPAPDLSPILSRLDRLQQRIDELAVQAPVAEPASDPTPQLALMVDRLSRLEQAFATLPGFFDQLRHQLDRLSLMSAAPTPPAALTLALDGLKTQLDDLRTAAVPPRLDGPLIPLFGEALHRLDLVALGLQALHERPVPAPANRAAPAVGLTPALRKRLDAIAAALPTKRRPPSTTSRSAPAARKKTAKRSGSRSKH